MIAFILVAILQAGMFPFLPSHSAPNNITNVRTWQGVGNAPAGSEGFIIAQEEHFVDGNNRERRFFGTNLGMTGNFPSHKAADKLVDELSRYGINLVRMHYVSHTSPVSGYPVQDSFIEPIQLERFDYLAAKLKEKGIYIYFQLNIARKFGRVNGVVNAHLLPYYKNGIDNVDPRILELQKRFLNEILNHINPYTGLAYKDEPAISMMEIANENSIVHSWFSAKHRFPDLVEPYKSEMLELWNKFLMDKYGSTEAISKAWGMRVKKKNIDWPYKEEWYDSTQRAEDFTEFLYECEHKYFTEFYSYLKDVIGVKHNLTGTQLGYGLNHAQASMDYCDIHNYWCHPAFPTGVWDNKHWNLRNGAVVNSYGHPANTFTKMARSRILGRPFTVSEYDHPNLNFYCSEGNIMMAAMGAFQNWSAIMQFAWILDTDYDREHIWPMFDMCSAPQKLVHLPACYAMFVRGDIRKASDKMVFVYNSELHKDIKKIADKRAADAPSKFSNDLLNSLPLVMLSGTKVSENPELFNSDGRIIIQDVKDVPESIKKAYKDRQMKSNTGEFIWNWQKEGAGYFMLDTRNTKVFSGFVRNREFVYKGMTLKPGKTLLDWLTLSLTLTKANSQAPKGGILRSGTYLLAASGKVQNTNQKIVELPNDKISCCEPDGGRLGTAPVLCEGIDAEIFLNNLSGRVKCYALDPEGNRKTELEISENGSDAILKISPDYQTLWYELIVE